jgi:hypothetical protein
LIATIATESGGTLQEPSQDFSVAVTTTNAPAIRRGRPRQSRKRVSEEGKGIRAGALGGTAQHFATQFPVQRRMVDHVVPVRTSFRSLQVRRAVGVSDVKVGEVLGRRSRIVEGEAGVQLKAVRGANRRRHGADRAANTDVNAGRICSAQRSMN